MDDMAPPGMSRLAAGSAITTILLVSVLCGSAAQAGNKGAKAQAEALKQAMAARGAVEQPEATAGSYADAKALLAGGDMPGALAGFRRALADDPGSTDAMNGMGVVYDRMGRHDLARGWYEAALAIAPDDAALLANLGYSLSLQKQWRAALPFLRAAAAGQDAAAAATARPLLALAAAAITAEAAAAPAAARPAELVLDAPAAGPARIELAGNGEAVLRLGGESRAPAPQLVAALGDAATLVLVPQREETQAAAHAPGRAEPVAVAVVQAPVLLVRGDAHAQWMATIDPYRRAPASAPKLELALAEAPRRPEPATPPRPPIALAAATLPEPMALVLTPVALARASAAPPPVLANAPRMLHARQPAPFDRLLPVRRTRPTGHGAPFQQLLAAEQPANRSADGDDGGSPRAPDALAGDDRASPEARQAAIARLEAVIARLQRA